MPGVSGRKERNMKRILSLLLCAVLLLALTGCKRAAGGAYKLDYITADGVRMTPSTFGMSISFTLEEEGQGTAVYNGSPMEIIWEDEGGKVTLTSPNGVLEFSKSGKTLILHSEGTLMFFTPVEEDD